MEFQNQIIRSLRNDLARLREVSGTSRTPLAERVCAAFGFRDARGRLQRATCLKALTVLEADGHISLPPRRAACRQRLLPGPVAPARDVPDTVGAVEGLELILVTDTRQSANGLIAHEHPRGAGPFVGCQLRYLVGSSHGYLGAVGFAASTRRLSRQPGGATAGGAPACTGSCACRASVPVAAISLRTCWAERSAR